MMRSKKMLSLPFLCAIVFLAPCTPLLANNSPEVPVVDGKVGSCQASFTVKDEAGKPIYNATIKVTLKYGLFNKRRMDLEIGTNSDGKARIIGLPDSPRKPPEFQITTGTVPKSVEHDPSSNCSPVYDAPLSLH